MKSLGIKVLGAILCVSLLLGCNELTREEAAEALDEMSLVTQASHLAFRTVHMSDNFTLGQAVEDAAEDLREFYETQLPCTEVTLKNNTVNVAYGVKGVCLYDGSQFTGTHRFMVKTAEETLLVYHEWIDFSNGIITVSGTADVTWSDNFTQRHVVHELEWTRIADGRVGFGSGDRVQKALNGDWSKGIVIDGEREWDGESGNWELELNDITARWIDPIPESGSCELNTPFDKSAILSFSRVDEQTIKATFETGARKYTFEVGALGTIK